MPIGKADATSFVDAIRPEPGVQVGSVPYIDAKSARILRQGVYQAVLNSPGVAGLSYANEEQFVNLVKSVAEKVINLVEGE